MQKTRQTEHVTRQRVCSVSDGTLILRTSHPPRRTTAAVPARPTPPLALNGLASRNGTLQGTVSRTPLASPTATSLSTQSSPSRPTNRREAQRGSTASGAPEPYTPEWRARHASSLLDTSDEMLLSLLAAQAVVDAREFAVLSVDEVEELKRDHALLSTRLAALRGKLRTETKIRNAAESLARLHASHKRMSRTTGDQLDAAVRKVEQVEREIGKVAERAADVGRKLGEHRAAVLAWSLTMLERKVGISPAPLERDEGDDELSTADGSPTVFSADPRSPVSATTTRSAGTSRAGTPKLGQGKFNGPHLFAGAEGATIPPVPRTPTAQRMASLEQQLRAAQDEADALRAREKALQAQLDRAAGEKRERAGEVQAMRSDLRELEREVERLEGEEMRAGALQAELLELRREKGEWAAERRVLEGRTGELERELGKARIAGVKAGGAEARVRELEERLREKEEAWAASGELREMRLAELERVQRGVQRLAREHLGRDDDGDALAGLERHLARTRALQAEKDRWEEERARLLSDKDDERLAMAKQVDAARREVDSVRRDLASHSRPSSPTKGAGSQALPDQRLLAALSELWHLLPSAEARAAGQLGRSRSRTPTSAAAASPTSARAGGVSPTGTGAGANGSLSDMDVRTLKQLYGDASRPPGHSPTASGSAESFSPDAFVQRCKALIADDKALMERLIRFAQAHDLLKANAERSQRLAQEGRVGMETYQKQVRALEERLQGIAQRETALLAEISDLQRALEDARTAKRALEEQAAMQAETCHSLSEANKVLSARTLTLAAEAADAPQAARNKVEAQVAELKRALDEAQDEVDSMKRVEASQRAQLLDELNAAQTENQALRDQLRARSAMK
ncbi:hypothetical protein CALCODRAFT_507025 [Calocera cornea HHB12733]|uniref:Up-regulated during septation protein 1 domain-containing protein n=1 Tax=Calocera cornea HHB12733 TaxID=1353952 RepID=A0A165I6G9_9BASI|nr:hypothetical protein CALCODRAFT_507025 [Calocera cornea HHB12733]